MPASAWERRYCYVRVNMPWRRLLKDRPVRRRVQGVDLVLPWGHRLPDFARLRPSYGQNLVELARALAQRAAPAAGPMQVLDIGANVGDSAKQILAAVDARALCVEGDPYWARYLHRNLDHDGRATIEEALLTPDDTPRSSATPVRAGGTTHFVEAEEPGSLPMVSVRALRDAHPDFRALRLVKSDTDGFDTQLVPAVAQAWSDAGPVLFFEFDPVLTRTVAGVDPMTVWTRLADLGYTRLAVWDNTGDPLGQLSMEEAPRESLFLEPRPAHLGYDFWDVAVCRETDPDARAAFDALMPREYDATGGIAARRTVRSG